MTEKNEENHKLNDKFVLWYHHEQSNWKLDGYRQIYTIESIHDYWTLFKNIYIFF